MKKFCLQQKGKLIFNLTTDPQYIYFFIRKKDIHESCLRLQLVLEQFSPIIVKLKLKWQTEKSSPSQGMVRKIHFLIGHLFLILFPWKGRSFWPISTHVTKFNVAYRPRLISQNNIVKPERFSSFRLEIVDNFDDNETPSQQ